MIGLYYSAALDVVIVVIRDGDYGIDGWGNSRRITPGYRALMPGGRSTRMSESSMAMALHTNMYQKIGGRA